MVGVAVGAVIAGVVAVGVVLGAVVVMGAHVGADGVGTCVMGRVLGVVVVNAVGAYAFAGTAPWVHCCCFNFWILCFCEVRALLKAMV